MDQFSLEFFVVNQKVIVNKIEFITHDLISQY